MVEMLKMFGLLCAAITVSCIAVWMFAKAGA